MRSGFHGPWLTSVGEGDMNRYRFEIFDGRAVHPDEDGLLLPGPRAAIEEARALAWALICDLAGVVDDWSV
jgi:hypothetical protein